MSETTTETVETSTTTTAQGEPEQLGDAGKKALDAERKRATAAEKAQKAAEARLAELERAQMTAEEQAKVREQEAEQRAAAAEAKALRREVALEHSLGADDAALLDGITDEDAMRRLAARLAVKSDNTIPGPRPDLSAGGREGELLPLNGDGIEAALRAKLGIS